MRASDYERRINYEWPKQSIFEVLNEAFTT